VKITVVGCGNMGVNHARILRSLGYLDKIVESSQHRKASLLSLGYGDYLADSLSDTNSDAYIIATPSTTHFEIAKKLLLQCKHVLIEKPACMHIHQYKELIDMSSRLGLKATAGHIERFNPAVVTLKAKCEGLSVNRVEIYRYSPKPPQINDIGVWFDLGVHDVDIMLQLMGMPSSVISSASYEDGTDISFHATYIFDRARSCSINVSWLGSVKRREALIYSKENELHCNLLTQSIVELSQLRTPRRDDHHFLPQITSRSTKIDLAREEPLKLELKSFVESITLDKPPAVSLSDAMSVHHLLSCAHRSSVEGQEIKIS